MKNRIQELRKERKITQSELADALEVTRQTIISLENGRYNASLLLAHKTAQYFGMSIEDIFIFEEGEDLRRTDLYAVMEEMRIIQQMKHKGNMSRERQQLQDA